MILAAALVVVIAVALLLARRHGDVVPVLLFFAIEAVVFFAVAKMPHSPVACISRPHGTCSERAGDWLMALGFVGPAGVMVLYKALRGDKRGVTGNWRAFRRARGR